MNEYPKNGELHQSGKMSILWQVQIAICLELKKTNAFCLFYSIMPSLGLQDIIKDKVVSQNHFLRNVLMRAHCVGRFMEVNSKHFAFLSTSESFFPQTFFC